MSALPIEPYTDADAADVAAFLASAAEQDATLVPLDVEGWRAFVDRSFNHGGRDFAVVRDGGAVVALLMSARFEEAGLEVRNVRAIVHPSHRRRGIGSRLADHVDGQDPDGGATVQASVLDAWAAGRHLVASRGLSVAHRQHWMTLAAAAPAPTPPPGVTLRPARGDAADDAAWLRLHELGYRDDEDFVPHTAEDLDVFRAAPRFHLWLAERDGRAVGFCHTEDFGGKGLVESLVTHPDERGRGTGRALLLAGIATLRAEDPGPVRLHVREANAPARALYASVGFETTEVIETWRRAPGG